MKIILIHDAYLKLKDEIDAQKVYLNTTIFNRSDEINFKFISIYETFRLDRLTVRKPFIKHSTKQKMPAEQIGLTKNVRTLQECYLICRTNDDCKYFNLCSTDGLEYNCDLNYSKNDFNSDQLITDNKCNVFKMKNSNLFDKHEGKRFADEPLIKLTTNLEDCTTKCLNRKDQKCKSVVFCGENNCELFDQHMENHLNHINHDKECAIYSGIVF